MNEAPSARSNMHRIAFVLVMASRKAAVVTASAANKMALSLSQFRRRAGEREEVNRQAAAATECMKF
jgi:hypothetical protein